MTLTLCNLGIAETAEDIDYLILEPGDTPADYPQRIQFTDESGDPVEWELPADH